MQNPLSAERVQANPSAHPERDPPIRAVYEEGAVCYPFAHYARTGNNKQENITSSGISPCETAFRYDHFAVCPVCQVLPH